MRYLAALTLLLGSSAYAAPVERRLHVAAAEASSFDKNDYNRFEENYLPLYVGDDDPTTAWTEGVPGDGTGEWLRVRFSSMKGATKLRVRIRNGYQKSHRLFAANERAKKVVFRLLPSNVTVERELKDAEGWQDVVLEQPSGVLAGVELKVGSVYKGAKYEDLCISDVQLFATAETPDNPAFEKSVFEKVKKWKADRVTAAGAFAKAAKDRPLPIAASYDVTKTEVPTDRWNKDAGDFQVLDRLSDKALSAPEREVVASLKKWLSNKGAAFEPVSLGTASTPKLPSVDGLCAPSLGSCEYDSCQSPLLPFDSLPLLTTDSFRVIEAKGRPSAAAALDSTAAKKVGACNSTDGTTLAWAVREGEDRHTRALIVVGCGVVEGREGKYIASSLEVLAYDVGGRLRVALSSSYATTFAWQGDGSAARIHGGSYAAIGEVGTFEATTTVAQASPGK